MRASEPRRAKPQAAAPCSGLGIICTRQAWDRELPMLLGKTASTVETCTVCLGDLDDTEMVKGLPQCGHAFHIDCVDTWVKTQCAKDDMLMPSCPTCRTMIDGMTDLSSAKASVDAWV